MMAGLKRWWVAHSDGERRLMSVLGVLIALVVLWLGIWRPLSEGVAAGWERQGLALDRYASVRTKVAAIRRLPAGSAASGSVAVDQLVGQSAAEAGFTLERAAAQGAGRFAVTIPAARMGPLLTWLAGLETQGVLVETISIAPGASDGVVSVQAVLKERGK